ncbi:flavin reductase family protein [Acetobacter garciniae]|uniref:flavin reductase family protein n=1 Tax=Acetobacter garciniae TaxID=2817435 RepID=UPI002EDB1D58
MPEDLFHTYRPDTGHGLRHDPFNAIVGPRPIGWISTTGANGRDNLAPYSFFNAFNYKPPVIGFSSIGWKDTVRNIQETGEFVWNLVTQPLVERMNMSSAAFAPEIDEFEIARLAKAPSVAVRPPRVAASAVQFECRLTQIIRLNAASGEDLSTWLTLGEVVFVHIRRDLVQGGVYQTGKPHPVLRAGGAGWYSMVTPQTMFELDRPPSVETALAMAAQLAPTPLGP